MGDDANALRYAEQALAHLEPLGDSEELADALHSLGWFHWRRGRLAEAEGPLRRSEEIAQRVGSLPVMGAALSTLGVLLTNIGRGEDGLAMLEEGFRIAKEIGDLRLLLRNYNNLPWTLHEVAPDPERSMQLIREGLELARKAGVRDSESWLLGSLAEHLSEAGDLETAEALAQEAVEVARAVGNPVLIGLRTRTVAWVLAQRGRGEEAEEWFRESDATAAANPEPQARIPLYVVGAMLARSRADREREIALLRDGVAFAGETEQEQLEELLLELIRVLGPSHGDEVRSVSGRLERSAAVRGAAVPHFLVAQGLTTGDPAEAVARLEQAATTFEGRGRRIDLARCLLDLARARAADGQDPRPDAERAVKLLRECDAQLFLPEAEAALAELDASLP
jgi:tetratricopeptide (TPR) repeat protein